MSVLLATKNVITARGIVIEMSDSLTEMELAEGIRQDLQDLVAELGERLQSVVNELEDALVPEGGSVAITLFPFPAPEMGPPYPVEREARSDYDEEEPWGTLYLPTPPDGSDRLRGERPDPPDGEA